MGANNKEELQQDLNNESRKKKKKEPPANIVKHDSSWISSRQERRKLYLNFLEVQDCPTE